MAQLCSPPGLSGYGHGLQFHRLCGGPENHEEWGLINASHLLSKFELQVGHHRSHPCLEVMEDVVEADTHPKMSGNDCLYQLTKYLLQSDPLGVGVSCTIHV